MFTQHVVQTVQASIVRISKGTRTDNTCLEARKLIACRPVQPAAKPTLHCNMVVSDGDVVVLDDRILARVAVDAVCVWCAPRPAPSKVPDLQMVRPHLISAAMNPHWSPFPGFLAQAWQASTLCVGSRWHGCIIIMGGRQTHYNDTILLSSVSECQCSSTMNSIMGGRHLLTTMTF